MFVARGVSSKVGCETVKVYPFSTTRPVAFDPHAEIERVLSQPNPVEWARTTHLPGDVHDASPMHGYLLYFRLDSATD